MHDFFAKPLFRVEPETFTWRDVILFGHVTDRWAPVLRGIEEGLACVRHAESLEEESLEDEVDAAAAEFRYDRELITAAETEAWLAERGLTPGEWLESVRRRVLRARFAESLRGFSETSRPSRREIERAARVDLICTALGRELAEACAEHAAVARELAPGPPGSGAAVPTGPLPAGLDPAHVSARQGLIEQILRGVQEFRLAQLTDEALCREVRSHQMDWVRLECESVSFPDLPQAREAALCLREDGLSIAEVAANAHLTVVPGRFYLEEIDEALRPVFLSAVPGDVIGPAAGQAGATVYRVRAKMMPAETDPAVRERAAGRLLARALANEGRRRVQWLISW
jgi:hypothetical protein